MPSPHERDPQRPNWRVFLDRYAEAWERYSQHPSLHNLQLLQTGEQLLLRELLTKPGTFPLGRLVMTPGADQAMTEAGHIPPEFLLRHKHGDWGDLDEEDKAENERSLMHGWRLLSAYHTRRDERLWVITEADRSATTLSLPAEY